MINNFLQFGRSQLQDSSLTISNLVYNALHALPFKKMECLIHQNFLEGTAMVQVNVTCWARTSVAWKLVGDVNQMLLDGPNDKMTYTRWPECTKPTGISVVQLCELESSYWPLVLFHSTKHIIDFNTSLRAYNILENPESDIPKSFSWHIQLNFTKVLYVLSSFAPIHLLGHCEMRLFPHITTGN